MGRFLNVSAEFCVFVDLVDKHALQRWAVFGHRHSLVPPFLGGPTASNITSALQRYQFPEIPTVAVRLRSILELYTSPLSKYMWFSDSCGWLSRNNEFYICESLLFPNEHGLGVHMWLQSSHLGPQIIETLVLWSVNLTWRTPHPFHSMLPFFCLHSVINGQGKLVLCWNWNLANQGSLVLQDSTAIIIGILIQPFWITIYIYIT